MPGVSAAYFAELARLSFSRSHMTIEALPKQNSPRITLASDIAFFSFFFYFFLLLSVRSEVVNL
jgi:hypothetical protein